VSNLGELTDVRFREICLSA